MQSVFRRYFLFIMASIFVFIYPTLSFAAVNLPWSTTFNCSEWRQLDGLNAGDVNCDGLTGHGGWVGTDNSGSYEEQITVAANNPSGGGGKGQRHWECDGYDINSGGLKITFVSPEPEVWVRWYMRYESGFKWNPLNMDKILYFNPGETHAAIPQFKSSEMNIFSFSSPNNHQSTGGKGWNTIMGGSTSDAKWHVYEAHLKMDTDGTDGIGEMWVDGTRVLYHNDINFGTATGWTYFVIGSNQLWPDNGKCMYVDFDDIAVSNTGYIGPLYPFDNMPPAHPLNAR